MQNIFLLENILNVLPTLWICVWIKTKSVTVYWKQRSSYHLKASSLPTISFVKVHITDIHSSHASTGQFWNPACLKTSKVYFMQVRLWIPKLSRLACFFIIYLGSNHHNKPMCVQAGQNIYISNLVFQTMVASVTLSRRSRGQQRSHPIRAQQSVHTWMMVMLYHSGLFASKCLRWA